jgi:hypothetical protein
MRLGREARDGSNGGRESADFAVICRFVSPFSEGEPRVRHGARSEGERRRVKVFFFPPNRDG